jgi:spermidine synthase
VIRIVFSLSLFLSAALLFMIQLMVAKAILPVYGGTPLVWTVCMLFFQLLMLVGYSYAWGLSKFWGTRWWRILHLCVCVASLFFLPMAFCAFKGKSLPELSILMNLLSELGLPLLVIAASAPLLQFAYSKTKAHRATDPYFLYVASNTGSLIALLSYPWLVERYLGLKQQFYYWNCGYLCYLVLLLLLFGLVRYEPFINRATDIEPLSFKRKAGWIVLSFIPCSLMLGVTFYISTDVAATPFLWILPLALYLLSFVITFAKRPILTPLWVSRNTLVALVFPILGFIIGANRVEIIVLILANLLGFFMLALLCHGELVKRRPRAAQLTTFYFCLALGGVLAGLFNGLVAPRLFSRALEYPLVMLVGLLLIPCDSFGRRPRWYSSVIVFALLLLAYLMRSGAWVHTNHVFEMIALVVLVLFSNHARVLFISMAILFAYLFLPGLRADPTLYQNRNFYGVKQVFERDKVHALMSENTLHGFQVMGSRASTDGGIGYYGSVLPVIRFIQAEKEQPLHAMVLGLGTGIMACQFRAADELYFVEVDAQMIDIASNSKLFSYLRDCPPDAKIIEEDGRIAVAQVPDASLEILILDAFSSDAIPVHLLTKEAFVLYQQKLKPDGVILVNISNRHLNVLPVVTASGRALDMIVLHRFQPLSGQLGQFSSDWALLTTNDSLAGYLMGGQGWRFVADYPVSLWTDDYSNLVPLLK